MTPRIGATSIPDGAQDSRLLTKLFLQKKSTCTTVYKQLQNKKKGCRLEGRFDTWQEEKKKLYKGALQGAKTQNTPHVARRHL
jgi:hypothetical protein